MAMQLKRMYIDRDGLLLFLGPVEAIVLKVLWEHDQPMTSSEIHRAAILEMDSHAAHATVDKTIRRMYAKGILIADHTARKGHYSPAYTTEDAFIEQCITTVLTALWRDYAPYMDRSAIQ